MRWIRFEHQHAVQYGQVQGDEVVAVTGLPWGEHKPTGKRYPLDSVRLLAPVLPPTFYAAGLNYGQHLKHYAALGGAGAKIPPSRTSATGP